MDVRAICDGALSEIVQAKQQEKLVRYFGVVASKDIVELSLDDVELEDDIADQRHLL